MFSVQTTFQVNVGGTASPSTFDEQRSCTLFAVNFEALCYKIAPLCTSTVFFYRLIMTKLVINTLKVFVNVALYS